MKKTTKNPKVSQESFIDYIYSLDFLSAKVKYAICDKYLKDFKTITFISTREIDL